MSSTKTTLPQAEGVSLPPTNRRCIPRPHLPRRTTTTTNIIGLLLTTIIVVPQLLSQRPKSYDHRSTTILNGIVTITTCDAFQLPPPPLVTTLMTTTTKRRQHHPPRPRHFKPLFIISRYRHHHHPIISIDDAEDDFVTADENLEPGETCLFALKSFATFPSEGSTNSKKLLLGAGALVMRPSSTNNNNNNNNIITCDAWMADALAYDGIGTNLQREGQSLLLDELFCRFLRQARRHEENQTWRLIVQCGTTSGGDDEFTAASYRAAQGRGFRPWGNNDDGDGDEDEEEEEEEEDGLVFDLSRGIRQYTTGAIDHAGTEGGRRMLEILDYLSCPRQAWDDDAARGDSGGGSCGQVRGSVLRRDGVIPLSITERLLVLANELYRRGYFFDEPDSVDGLPGDYLSIMSPPGDDDDDDDDKVALLHREIRDIMDPIVNDTLLPTAQSLFSSSSSLQQLRPVDIFIRRYDNEGMRRGIPGHYDTHAVVTAVVALDDSAREGDVGLYTVVQDDDGGGATTTDHPARRRYFAMAEGDVVWHSYDVMHGVDVNDGGNGFGNERRRQRQRMSLVVWFGNKDETETEEEEGEGETPNVVESSLAFLSSRFHNNTKDDVTNFILAGALESIGTTITPHVTARTNDNDTSGQSPILQYTSHDLYITSALKGNTNALTRLGSLCKDQLLKPHHIFTILPILDDMAMNHPRVLTVMRQITAQRHGNDDDNSNDNDDYNDNEETIDNWDSDTMAQLLWLKAAQGGNQLSQQLLADDLSSLVVSSESSSPALDDIIGVLYELAKHG